MNFGTVLKAFDLLMLAGTAARRLKGRSAEEGLLSDASLPGPPGLLETKLTGVVVAALKEAFERDHSRLELEREQLEAQRRRAEQALRLELRRQTIDRELARLQLVTWVALVGWIASVALLALRVGAAPAPARALVAAGWVLLLAALAAAFSAQRKLSATTLDETSAPPAGAVAPVWFLVGGLAAAAGSLLF